MASKKYKLLLGLLVIMTSSTFAQMGKSYNVYDSSVITKKGKKQQNEFWNNTYNFPAKPRNMWEVGVSLATLGVSGDVAAKLPTFGFEAHVRKSIGYVFSLRLQYVNGVAKGQNWQGSSNFSKNPAWGANLPANIAADYKANGAVPVYYNYKTNIQDLSLQGIVSLNQIRFHKQKTGISAYGGLGIGVTWYKTMINAYNESRGESYNNLFQSINTSAVYKNRKEIRKELKNGMDNTYETKAETEGGSRRPTLGNNTLVPSGTILFGVAYKFSKRINMALEGRHTFVKTDLLDGQQWQEAPLGDAAQTRDYDSWSSLSLGLNFNLGGKSVEPLWWLNPLDYAYSELNNPKHMKLPKPVFDDADGDGVVDQLDREPNTPAGAPVDTHGVSKDTDGDGVADFQDK
ncbi:MAG: hypothetical protein HY305_02795, partial [Sphingobacteriales bacterium]|nr:hypothetical protein [Sphingobacteriales bacterium]